MKVSKQGILQSGLIEADGNAKVYGDDVVVGENLINESKCLLIQDIASGSNATMTECTYNGIKGYRITKTENGGWDTYVNFPIDQSKLDKNKKYSLSAYIYYLSKDGQKSLSCFVSSGPSTNSFINSVYFAQEGLVKWENLSPRSDYDASNIHGTYGWHPSFVAPCDIFIAQPKFEEGEKCTPWVPNSADPIYATYDFANKDKSIPAPIQANEFYEI